MTNPIVHLLYRMSNAKPIKIMSTIPGGSPININVDRDASFQHGLNQRPSRWALWLALSVIALLLLIFVMDRIFDPNNAPIKYVEVNGEERHVDKQKIQQQILPLVSGNFFSTNLDELEGKIKNFQWIHDASVRRQWPSTIVVDFVELQPVAKWGDNEWLNFDGRLVGENKISPQQVNADLPILYGAGQSDLVLKSYQSWAPLFTESGLKIIKLVRDRQGAWNAEIGLNSLASDYHQTAADNPLIELTFSGVNADQELSRFFDVFNEHLLNHFGEIKTIDLRYPNGFAIGWKQQPLQSKDFLPKQLFTNNISLQPQNN